MGRAVVIEERIQSKLKTLITSSQVHLGLLVGQLASSKDYVSLFVRTPALQEVASDDEQRCEVNNLNAFEDWWVKEHARQVSALLCGGLSIVGVAVCCSTEQFKEHQLKCRQWLNDVTPSPSPGSSILLHCPTNSKKFTCQTIDLSDAQATFRPADLKFQSHVDHWTRLESVLALQWMSYVPTDQTSHMTSPGSILKPLLEQMSSAMLVVRGQPAMQGSDMLVKTKKLSPSQAIQMEWLSQLYASESGLPQMLPPGTRKVCVDGYLSLVAYVPPKASLDDARAAMRQDAERSLLARTATLMEGRDTQQHKFGETEQLPCRVAVSIPDSPIVLYEYMLPNESIEECTNRICELTGCQATELTSHVLEQFSPPTVVAKETITMETVDSKVVKGYSGLVSIVAAVGVALLAVAFWLITTLQS